MNASLLAVLGVFVVYACVLVYHMVRLRTTSHYYMAQFLLTLWMCVAIGLNVVASSDRWVEAEGAAGLLVPLAQIAKDSSAMAVIALWSKISAAKLQDLGVPHTQLWLRVLRRALPIFVLCLLAGATVLFAPPAFSPAEIDLSDSWRASAYRWLIAFPIAAYATAMVAAILRFSGAGRNSDEDIRRRLHYFATAWCCAIVWAFLYAGWIAPINEITQALIVPTLIVACFCGFQAVKFPGGQSRSDQEIETFEHDHARYTTTRLSVEGFLGEHQVDYWVNMQDLLRLMYTYLGPRYIDEVQLKAAQNALYFVDRPNERAVAETTHFPTRSPSADFRPSVYGIPEDCPFKEEIEEDIEVHNRACWLAGLLGSPNLPQRLQSEPPWVQIAAVVAAYGSLLPTPESKGVLDQDRPCVEEGVLHCFEGIRHRLSQRD